MTQNSDAAGTDEPEHSPNGTRVDGEWDSDDEKAGVELRRGCPEKADIEIIALQLADSPHATNHQENDEEQRQVGEKAVDEEHDKDGGIVAGEVAKVVVDPALDLAKVLGLGEAAEVEELAYGLEVRKSRGDG